MKVTELAYPHSIKQSDCAEAVAAIGFFDGIHRGHQVVINRAIEEARNRQLKSVVITFFPHPSVVLSNGNEQVKYITPYEKKIEVLQSLGVDEVFIIKFNKELASLSPKAFLDHFVTKLNIKHLVAGFDYSFGHRGEGNMKMIGSLVEDELTYEVMDKVQEDDEKISSTRIRLLLSEGNVQKATALLGRPLTVKGRVIEGYQRGRTIGYPTANLDILDKDALLPKAGVYAVRVVYNGKKYDAFANLGYNPTFKITERKLKLEVHIFDFKADLYGQILEIEWCHFVRDEHKFSSVDALINQIKEDEQTVRSYFSI